MAENKTETKSQILNRLFKENGLIAEDYYQHKHYTIITRSGIEKIQYKNNITIGFEAVKMEVDFCVVKATATKKVSSEIVRVETFGSAGHGAKGEADQGKLKTNQYAYYPELAEKRALSRAVLKITNFYELGVFGEDEADDFKQKTDTPQPAPEKKATAEKAMQVAIEPKTSKNEQEATEEQLEILTTLLNHELVSPDMKARGDAAINEGLSYTVAAKKIQDLEGYLTKAKTKAA